MEPGIGSAAARPRRGRSRRLLVLATRLAGYWPSHLLALPSEGSHWRGLTRRVICGLQDCACIRRRLG